MESLLKSILIGIFVGVIGTLFLSIFSDYVSENSEAMVFAIFSGIAFIIIDLSSKKLKSKRKVDS